MFAWTIMTFKQRAIFVGEGNSYLLSAKSTGCGYALNVLCTK